MAIGQGREPPVGTGRVLLETLGDGLVQLLGEMFPAALLLLAIVALCVLLFVFAYGLGKRMMPAATPERQADSKPSQPRLPPPVAPWRSAGIGPPRWQHRTSFIGHRSATRAEAGD